ncbi:MAG: hypothetical protein ABFS08_12100 [Pseudomonadota bacterium]
MRHFSLISATLLLTLAAAAPASADTLQLPQTGPTTPVPAGMEVPVRGMHMEQVELMYGKPPSISPPVGDPPITTWGYPGYSVYFEYSYVIQSVVNR